MRTVLGVSLMMTVLLIIRVLIRRRTVPKPRRVGGYPPCDIGCGFVYHIRITLGRRDDFHFYICSARLNESSSQTKIVH